MADTTDHPSGGLAYQLAVLAKMLDVLPPAIREPLLNQQRKVVEAILAFQANLHDLKELIETNRLNAAYITFDLEATKRERDQLRRQLGLEDNDGGQDPDNRR
jgi:hypothetical protein